MRRNTSSLDNHVARTNDARPTAQPMRDERVSLQRDHGLRGRQRQHVHRAAQRQHGKGAAGEIGVVHQA